MILLPLYLWVGNLLLAKGKLAAAEDLTRSLLERAEEKGMRRLHISGWILLAQIQLARGDRNLALQTLERAVGLAEPEGYIQLLLDAKQTLSELMETANWRGKYPKFDLALAGAPYSPDSSQAEEPAVNSARPRENAGFSRREIEVLHLLAEGLPNKEIAQRLFISLRTVKYHTTNIFTKLNVENRTQAVMQAKKLGVL
jgi:LuxR family maltose regulon positive regulatory protein